MTTKQKILEVKKELRMLQAEKAYAEDIEDLNAKHYSLSPDEGKLVL